MDYKTALTITREFQSHHYVLVSRPTDESLRQYGEAAMFLKNYKKAS